VHTSHADAKPEDRRSLTTSHHSYLHRVAHRVVLQRESFKNLGLAENLRAGTCVGLPSPPVQFQGARRSIQFRTQAARDKFRFDNPLDGIFR